jgi:PEP-CTERM motif
MKKIGFAILACASIASATPAFAAQFTFNFATSQQLFGGPVAGNGVFTTADTASQVGGQTAFAITSISGFVNGLAIVAPTGFYGNYFTTGPSFLDGSGVNFNVAGGGRIAFFNQSSNGLYRVNTFSPGGSSFVTATSAAVAAVPEASTWLLMLVGFGAVGYASRRRHRSGSTAYAR